MFSRGFLGVVPTSLIETIVAICEPQKWPAVYVACSGTFRTERGLLGKFPELENTGIGDYRAIEKKLRARLNAGTMKLRGYRVGEKTPVVGHAIPSDLAPLAERLSSEEDEHLGAAMLDRLAERMGVPLDPKLQYFIER